MNPKLNILARQLGRGISTTAEPENPQARMMSSYKDDVDRQAKAAIRVAEDKLAAALSENAALKTQLAEAGKDTTRGQKEYGHKLDSVKDAHKLELEALGVKHYNQMGGLQDQLANKTRECADVCQDKVRAETELAGAKKMIARLEQTVSNLQNEIKTKPIDLVGTVEKPQLMKIRITQRDEHGRIVELSEV